MALLSPAFIRGLATTFEGEDLATKLGTEQAQLAGYQLDLQRARAKDQAGDIFAKAMERLWAAAPAQPVSIPTAPQPGAPSVPQTASAPGVPSPTPGTPGLGAPSPGSTQPPPTAQAAPGDGMPSFGAPAMDPYAILRQIQKENPNLPPGVLASVVNDYIMPMMTTQQQSSFKQFKDWLDYHKFSEGEKDKAATLAMQLDRIDAALQIANLSNETKVQLEQMREDAKRQLHAMIVPRLHKISVAFANAQTKRQNILDARERLKKVDPQQLADIKGKIPAELTVDEQAIYNDMKLAKQSLPNLDAVMGQAVSDADAADSTDTTDATDSSSTSKPNKSWDQIYDDAKNAIAQGADAKAVKAQIKAWGGNPDLVN
jgi:hypothetical protein